MHTDACVMLTLETSSAENAIILQNQLREFLVNLSKTNTVVSSMIKSKSLEIACLETDDEDHDHLPHEELDSHPMDNFVPNETTVQAILRAREGKNLKKFPDVKSLMDDLNSEKGWFTVYQMVGKKEKPVKTFMAARSASKWIKEKVGGGLFAIQNPDGSFHRWNKRDKWKKF